MNKKIGILLVICFSPPFIFLGYFLVLSLLDNRTGKEIYLDNRLEYEYNFKIDTIYRDSWNHNELTLRGLSERDIVRTPPEWEYGVFKIGDSIVKSRNSLKIYLYKDKKLDTILDYHSIYRR